MSARVANPLNLIPSARTVERALQQTEEHAAKLRALLDIARQIEAAGQEAARRRQSGQAGGKAVQHVR